MGLPHWGDNTFIGMISAEGERACDWGRWWRVGKMGSVRGLVTHVGGGTHQAKMRSAPDGKWERLEGTWQELVERLNGVVCNLRMTVQEGVYTMRSGVSRGHILWRLGSEPRQCWKPRGASKHGPNQFFSCLGYLGWESFLHLLLW